MRLLCAGLLTVFLGVPAVATVEPGKEGILAEFVRPVPGERVCFARTYNAQHLAKHPKQTVTAIAFHLSYFRHEPDAHNARGQRNYYYRLAVSFRARPGETFTATGDCLPGKDSIFCSVECDGGGVRVQWRKRPESILIDYGNGHGIRLSACGGDDHVDKETTEEERAAVEEEQERRRAVLRSGEDDKSFLLTRVKDADCPEFQKWWE